MTKLERLINDQNNIRQQEAQYNSGCKTCGNPKEMYWCENCTANTENTDCPACGNKTTPDPRYHDNCNGEPIQEKDIIRDDNGDELEQ